MKIQIKPMVIMAKDYINNFNTYSKRNFMELENENINFGSKNP